MDEMAADEADPLVTEGRVINQFAQGIHERLVLCDVKKYFTQNRFSNKYSINVLETASDFARDPVVKELYTYTRLFFEQKSR